MQDRLRHILEEQMPYIGQGDMANRRAAGRNPWIGYLKSLEASSGIPYNELMRDPGVRQEYDSLKGSGALVGGTYNCWDKFRQVNAGKKILKKDAKGTKSAYTKYLKSSGCVKGVVPRKKKVVKRKTAGSKTAKKRVSDKGTNLYPGLTKSGNVPKSSFTAKALAAYSKPDLKKLLIACLKREGY